MASKKISQLPLNTSSLPTSAVIITNIGGVTYQSPLSALVDPSPYKFSNTNSNAIIPKLGNNTSSGYYSNVSGGSYNIASGNCSNVNGGSFNTACKGFSNVAGGYCNTASGYYSNVAGGMNNTASGDYSSVSNGLENISSANYSNIVGGVLNTASAYASNIAGGWGNNASNDYSNVAGGRSNTASACYSNVAGGYINTASGCYSNVAGGRNNTASNYISNVAGGGYNTASGYYSNITGGYGNTASGYSSTIAGGFCNTASGRYSSILGGRNNNTNNQCNTFILGSNITANAQDTTYVNNLFATNNIVIQGSLSAAGGATFADTVFTTTSALSVVNLGVGPALYVYQASGPYDVASFVDGDGIEVLHVGNANFGQTGKIGINQSFPNKELTVTGEISATGIIYALSGNSSSWNSVYNSVLSNSANNASINYVNSNYLPLTGGTIIGEVNVLSGLNAGYGNLTLEINENSVSVYGPLSSNNTIYDSVGNSTEWNSVYTTVYNTSADWDSTYTNQTNYLPLSGGTITGDVTILSGLEVGYGNLTLEINENSVSVYVPLSSNNAIYDSVGNSNQWNSVYTSVLNTSASNASINYVNSNYLPLTGGTITGPVEINASEVDNVLKLKGKYGGYLDIVLTDESFTAGYPAPVGSIGSSGEGFSVKYGVGDTQWGKVVYSTNFDEGDEATIKNLKLEKLKDGNNNFVLDTTGGFNVYNTANSNKAIEIVDNQLLYNVSNEVVLDFTDKFYIKKNTRIDADVTIFGNLTSTGTQTFANTIFSTTSSLSVYHVGTGPALWVGNYGTGDIASFYDLDKNIEILHVGGNDGIFPNVGVKTSYPNKDFTVNGEISASGDIWTSGRIISDIIETGSGSITLFVSSGLVGINTELPNKSLTVNGEISASGDIWTSGRIISDIIETGSGSITLFVSSGLVGINTELPNKSLTVNGEISASGIIYALSGNSSNWNSVYSSWETASATSIVSYNDTRFSKLSSQAYKLTYPRLSISPINGNNTASGYYSNVNGGYGNNVLGDYSSIGGGICNNASGYVSTISGGRSNTASGCKSTVSGGYCNSSCGYSSTVSGGCCNTAFGYASNVSGGISNTASNYNSNVSGGRSNTASGCISTVSGGCGNSSCGYSSTVSGGCFNTASGCASNVSGGIDNTACGDYSNVTGGRFNTVSGAYSHVAGGRDNIASGDYSAILGGSCNDTNNKSNTFTLGSSITASQPNYTYVNNLSSQNNINATVISSMGGNSNQWNSAYSNQTNFLPLSGGIISANSSTNALTVVGNISATQNYFSGSNKSVFTPQTNTVGISAISNIVAVSVLPATPNPSTLYIII